MQLSNLKVAADQVNFAEAIKRGLGQAQGLYFPDHITPLADVDALLAMPFVARSQQVLRHLIGGDIPAATLDALIEQAFSFPAPLVAVDSNVHCLELFHGPTLAFKDFGARFMAQCLAVLSNGNKITILTATSGDTGAAVAHAFHGVANIEVVILFPEGKIAPLQEKLFSTLGGNIHAIAIKGDFDACQTLVKTAFDDSQVRDGLHLNSANSINISRLLAQVCYYFEAVAQLETVQRQAVVLSVPSGNFGNLTAGMIAKVLGLPIQRFVAATNLNDTVPRYWASNEWAPQATRATMSNAMDVSEPNNWPRIEAMIERGYLSRDILTAESVDEEYTQLAMKHLQALGYIGEPHAAVAYKALMRDLQPQETGIFLGTAHPAKFRDTVENILGQPIPLPAALVAVADNRSLAVSLDNDYAALKQHLLSIC